MLIFFNKVTFNTNYCSIFLNFFQFFLVTYVLSHNILVQISINYGMVYCIIKCSTNVKYTAENTTKKMRQKNSVIINLILVKKI